MEDIEKHARSYLKALYGMGKPATEVMSVQNLPEIMTYARRRLWIVEGPDGSHGLTPLGVKEIGE